MLWLIGAGALALEYAKVLNVLNVKYSVIGRGKKSAQKFTSTTGVKVFSGGLSKFLDTNPTCASKAIVCVNIEELKVTSENLIKYGVKHILLEKPGGINIEEVNELNKLVRKKNVNVKIAYNRRFYSSVIKAKELIKRDGGVQNFNFDFTEWTHLVDKLNKNKLVLKNWFFANSTHVVDLAFYLGGKPNNITSYVSKNIFWNKSPSLFCGAGKTKEGAIFSYHANWQSAGRWSLELLTAKGKYILCPLEQLFFQKKGSLEIQEIKLNSKLDKNFKPGFYAQLKAFINQSDDGLLSLPRHCSMLSFYKKISGFN
ncbi:Gfo/Idh/MocA family oxidoreductase [Candidatus Pelagibacter ubique]|nr:Gfo/Idh/MocA family oxidoreductase [Candidatus Pelagibacter ubique]